MIYVDYFLKLTKSLMFFDCIIKIYNKNLHFFIKINALIFNHCVMRYNIYIIFYIIFIYYF